MSHASNGTHGGRGRNDELPNGEKEGELVGCRNYDV